MYWYKMLISSLKHYYSALLSHQTYIRMVASRVDLKASSLG